MNSLNNIAKGKIPIVFAANDAYTFFCYVAVYSLVKNTSPQNEYHIIILVTDMSERNRRILEELSTENIVVECKDISAITRQVWLEGSKHLSIETYYRLFIPLVLPEYDKVIYLDSDLVVLQDIAELYETNLDGKAMGFVHEVLSQKLFEVHSLELGGLDYRNTFNAGVLLMDTRLFEAQEIRDKCLKLLQEDYQRKERKLYFADQDALNITLYKKTAWLDLKWNCEVQFADRIEAVDDGYVDEYLNRLDTAAIYHFAGTEKPWAYPMRPKANLFWELALETPYFKEVLNQALEQERKVKFPVTSTRDYIFPYSSVEQNARIVIYGAGRIGKEFVRQLRIGRYATVVLWCDKNWEQLDEKLQVRSISEIRNIKYDYIVVAIKKKKTYQEVKRKLISMGVPEDKIIWEEYQIR